MSSVNALAEFRALLDQAGAFMESGDPRWEEALAAARACAAGLPADAAGEAGIRLHIADHFVALRDNDLPRARGHLGTALALLDDDPSQDPVRFGLLDDLLKTHLLAEDLPAAAGTLRLMESLAWEGPQREVMLRNREGDLALAGHDYRAAQAAYNEAVAVARAHPELAEHLGAALVSLATAQSHAGDADSAERTVAQARAVVDSNINDLAGLYEVELSISRIRGDVAAAHRIYADYQRFLADKGEFAHRVLHDEAAAGSALEAQATGEHEHAAVLYRELAESAGHATNRSLSLLRAAAATWDSGDHAGAFALLDDAAAGLSDSSYLTLRASIEIYRAQFVASLPYLSIPVVRSLLPRAQAATIVLRHLSFQVDTAAARREFARYWATEAVEVCCHLAFEIGDNRSVADIIDLVAATPAVRVAGPSLLVSAPPRTGGLQEAYRIAAAEYGVRVEDPDPRG